MVATYFQLSYPASCRSKPVSHRYSAREFFPAVFNRVIVGSEAGYAYSKHQHQHQLAWPVIEVVEVKYSNE